MTAPLLTLDAVELAYLQGQRRKVIIDHLSFTLAPGEIASLLGPSGCGKTTALRAIAGFEPIYQGRIVLNGHTLSVAGKSVPPEKRQIGMMFQDYALFPHLTIAQNIAFGLHKMPKAQAQGIVEEMLSLTGLEGYGKAFPHELSGGQQQRVALARAIAPSPQLLLLDEPFSNLDVDTREKLATQVRDILKLKSLSAILVTHNQVEAFVFADKIGILSEGALLQWGSPADLIHRPSSEVVRHYIRDDAVAAFTKMCPPMPPCY